MNRLIILLAALCFSFTGEAQQNKKFVLVEHFTNTWCPICASKNPAIYEVLNKYEDQVIHITYYPSVPYSQDPLYQYDKEGNGERQSYYEIRSTPTLFINGESASSTSSRLEDQLKEELDQESSLQIEIAEEGQSSRDLTVTVTNLSSTGEERELSLFVAFVEGYLEMNANNGEDEHFDVFRGWITSKEGNQFSVPAAGESVTFSLSYDIPDEVNEEEAYALVFIQDKETKEVMNAFSTEAGISTPVQEKQSSPEIVKLHPNPVTDFLHVELTSKGQIHFQNIIDESGKVVLPLGATQHLDRIDVSGLIPGIYTLRIDIEGKIRAFRFIKM